MVKCCRPGPNSHSGIDTMSATGMAAQRFQDARITVQFIGTDSVPPASGLAKAYLLFFTRNRGTKEFAFDGVWGLTSLHARRAWVDQQSIGSVGLAWAVAQEMGHLPGSQHRDAPGIWQSGFDPLRVGTLPDFVPKIQRYCERCRQDRIEARTASKSQGQAVDLGE